MSLTDKRCVCCSRSGERVNLAVTVYSLMFVFLLRPLLSLLAGSPQVLLVCLWFAGSDAPEVNVQLPSLTFLWSLPVVLF